MKIDLKRDARQDESTNKWAYNKGIGAVDACPRFGKTHVGLKAINKNRNKHPTSNIVILTPSESIEKHWEFHLSTHRYHPDAKTTIITSHKAKNQVNKLKASLIDILIVDELHKYSSEDNLNLLKELATHSKFRLGLTGTYPYDNKTIKSLFPVVDVITEQEARDNGWISDYYEYNVPTILNDDEKVKYSKYSELISETLDLFRGKAAAINGSKHLFDDDYDLIMSCYLGKRINNPNLKYLKAEIIRNALAKIMGWNRDLDLTNSRNRDIDAIWRPENIYERCKAFKQFVANRNNILINNKSKLNTVLDIIKLNDVPTIIFNESTDFANEIANAIGEKAIVYHSKIKSRPMMDGAGNVVKTQTGKVKMFGAQSLKKLAIEGFKTERYKYLVTAKSLNEGLDLPSIQQVIITAGTANPIDQVQRSARGKTTDSFNPDKLTHIFNLYVDDFFDVINTRIVSRDKSKLIQRQSKYTHSVIWLNSLKEITL